MCILLMLQTLPITLFILAPTWDMQANISNKQPPVSSFKKVCLKTSD